MARNADRMGVAGSLASPAGSWSGRTPALRSTPRAAVPTPLATPATVPRTAPRAPLNTTQDLIAGKEAGAFPALALSHAFQGVFCCRAPDSSWQRQASFLPCQECLCCQWDFFRCCILETTQLCLVVCAGARTASVEHVEPAADGAEPINFFGSNATTTRHFAEEEGDSDDEETQRTDPDSAVRDLQAHSALAGGLFSRALADCVGVCVKCVHNPSHAPAGAVGADSGAGTRHGGPDE